MRANHPLSSIEHQVMWEPPDLGKLKALPMRFRIGDDANAFLGGFRLWADDKRGPPNVPPRPER